MRCAALSYTWGSREQYCLTTQNTGILEEIGGLSSPRVRLNPTVTDAMQVYSRLDVTFLWVDSLYIVQDDQACKHSQIQNMDFFG